MQQQKTANLFLDSYFMITVNEKNKLVSLEVFSAKTNSVRNFIELSFLLRHFLNKNDVDYKTTFYYDKTIFDLQFKSTKQKNTRLLKIVFQCTGQIEEYCEAEFIKKDENFTEYEIEIDAQTAQFWLETLNKFQIQVVIE